MSLRDPARSEARAVITIIFYGAQQPCYSEGCVFLLITRPTVLGAGRGRLMTENRFSGIETMINISPGQE